MAASASFVATRSTMRASRNSWAVDPLRGPAVTRPRATSEQAQRLPLRLGDDRLGYALDQQRVILAHAVHARAHRAADRIGVGTQIAPSCSMTQRNHSRARCEPPTSAVRPPLSRTHRGGSALARFAERPRLIERGRCGERRGQSRRERPRVLLRAWRRAHPAGRGAPDARGAREPPR